MFIQPRSLQPTCAPAYQATWADLLPACSLMSAARLSSHAYEREPMRGRDSACLHPTCIRPHLITETWMRILRL